MGVEQSTPFPIMDNDIIDSFTGENFFLSNFALSDITYNGVLYPTVEHAYQASKTLDLKERCGIASLTTPSMAKHAGKKVKLRDDWDKIKLNIMEELISLKFEIPNLHKRLQETFPKELIEGNYWHDTFWGVCNGKGQNHLGKLLMKIRQRNDFIRRLKQAELLDDALVIYKV